MIIGIFIKSKHSIGGHGANVCTNEFELEFGEWTPKYIKDCLVHDLGVINQLGLKMSNNLMNRLTNETCNALSNILNEHKVMSRYKEVASGVINFGYIKVYVLVK